MEPASSFFRAYQSLALISFLVLGSIVGQGHAAGPQEPLVTVEASTNSVTVAEPFTLSWTVTATEGAKVAFPQVGAVLGDFDIINKNDRFDVPDKTNPKIRTWRRSLVLESLTTGAFEIPPLEIQVRNATNEQSLRSDPFRITVTSVLEGDEDPEDFLDIQPVIDADLPDIRSNTSIGWILGTICASALALGGGILVWSRKKIVSPRQLAFTRLRQVEQSIDTETPSSESFAVLISSIARDFLKVQLDVHQAGTTDVELLENVVLKNLLDADASVKLGSLFRLVDQAKFAGTTLSLGEMKETIGHVKNLVDQVSQGMEVAKP